MQCELDNPALAHNCTWSLLQVDPMATTSFLGYVVAMYSVGQLVASPLFGVWSNYRPVREPILVSIIFNILANLVYAYVNAFPSQKKFVLLISRTFVGFGAGKWWNVRPSWLKMMLEVSAVDV